MNYKRLIGELKNKEAAFNAAKARAKHYKELLEVGVSGLKFSNMLNDSLLGTLSEIETFTSDKLAKEVIKNAKERYNLDKIIHARVLFGQK